MSLTQFQEVKEAKQFNKSCTYHKDKQSVIIVENKNVGMIEGTTIVDIVNPKKKELSVYFPCRNTNTAYWESNLRKLSKSQAKVFLSVELFDGFKGTINPRFYNDIMKALELDIHGISISTPSNAVVHFSKSKLKEMINKILSKEKLNTLIIKRSGGATKVFKRNMTKADREKILKQALEYGLQNDMVEPPEVYTTDHFIVE